MTEEVIRGIMQQNIPGTIGAAFRRVQQFPAQLAATRAQTQLHQAQTLRALAQAQHPMAEQALTGAAGKAFSLERLRQQFGQDHPVFQRALQLFNEEQNLMHSRANYFSANLHLKNLPTNAKSQQWLNWQNFNAQRQENNMPIMHFDDWARSVNGKNTLPPDAQVDENADVTNVEPFSHSPEIQPHEHAREHLENAAPTFTKESQALPEGHFVEPVVAKFRPTTPITSIDFRRQANQTAKLLQKQSTPTKILDQANQIGLLVRSLDRIDPRIFLPYTGIKGKGRYAADLAMQAKGDFVPELIAYNNFLNVDLGNIADQFRRTYQTSIVPGMFNILKRMSNPVSWKNNPDGALSAWSELNKIVRDQQQIYGLALEKPITAFPPPGKPSERLSVEQVKREKAEREAKEKGFVPKTEDPFEQIAREEGLSVETLRRQFG